MIVAGMDIGSITTETVILRDRNILTSVIMPTGANSRNAAERCLSAALEKTSLNQEDLTAIVTTGYGRASFPGATKRITEITCHARGAFFVHPQTRTVIDIGGQDSKVIRLDTQGRNVDFQMNDKCAAGTGRFLEVMAHALEVKVEDLGRLSLIAPRTIKISSMCTVFAESEVVSLIADDQPKEVIIRGLHESIADRILGMVSRVGIEEEVTLTGGVAKNEGVVQALHRARPRCDQAGGVGFEGGTPKNCAIRSSASPSASRPLGGRTKTVNSFARPSSPTVKMSRPCTCHLPMLPSSSMIASSPAAQVRS